jgi:hypothetical protein
MFADSRVETYCTEGWIQGEEEIPRSEVSNVLGPLFTRPVKIYHISLEFASTASGSSPRRRTAIHTTRHQEERGRAAANHHALC